MVGGVAMIAASFIGSWLLMSLLGIVIGFAVYFLIKRGY